MFSSFAFEFTDRNRLALDKFDNETELVAYLDKHNVMEDFINYADDKGVKRRNLLINKSHALIKNFLYAAIIYDRFDTQEYNRYLNLSDKTVKKAVEVIEKYGGDPMKLPRN